MCNGVGGAGRRWPGEEGEEMLLEVSCRVTSRKDRGENTGQNNVWQRKASRVLRLLPSLSLTLSLF